MSDSTTLVNEIDKLEALLEQIGAVTARDDPERRRELVALRRELSEQIAAIGVEAETVFEGTSDHADYRKNFSHMRSMAALHQASWPAVLVGERPEEYRGSVKPMREANRAFITWARDVLARRP